ncbi:MAG: MFS transporter, partial [Planktotalea sp.]
PQDRARATAGLFVYAYFGFSLPVIASGALADMLGLLTAMTLFAALEIVITGIIVTLWKRQSARPTATVETAT